MLALWKTSYDQTRHCIKKQRHCFADKGPSSQSFGFSSSHVWMWELDHKKAEHHRIDAFELWCWRKLLDVWCWSPLDGKEIQPVHPKVNQSWIFIGRTDAEAETPIFWTPDAKNWRMGKDLEAGNDWNREEKGMKEDKTVGWHHQHNGHEFEYAPGVGDGQGSLAYCSPWGHKKSDTTEQLNWTELNK